MRSELHQNQYQVPSATQPQLVSTSGQRTERLMEGMHGKGSSGLDLCGFHLFEALGEGFYGHSCKFGGKWSCKRKSRRGYLSYSYISPQVANKSPETKQNILRWSGARGAKKLRCI